MYTIKCDSFTLYDGRTPELIITNPNVNLEVNTVCSATFNIYHNHPYYDRLQHLKSVFEISDEIGVIFRGRMTDNTLDFHNSKAVDLEGSMAYFNDSIVRPFVFPDDFFNDADYIAAEESGNVVEFFLNWLIENHNSQVKDFQKFKLGKVTVKDPNNYVTRSSDKNAKTWSILKSKLFDSALGGNLCIRYESDGNYIDYLAEFELTNTQEITYGKNLLDLKNKVTATGVFTAMIPTGATVEKDGVKSTVTIERLDNETFAGDIVKDGDTIYSISAVEQYGFIYADPEESTWEDVTEATNLLNKAIEKLTGQGRYLSSDVEYSAADLHFTNEEIRSFRIYRNVIVNSAPHGQQKDIYPLTKLDMDLFNPQNTKIRVGKTTLTMTDTSNKNQADVTERIESAEKDIAENRNQISQTKETVLTQSTQILNNCEQIIMGALESYVETGDYEEFKKTVEAEFQIVAGKIEMNFTTVIDELNNVNGDLQRKFNRLYKNISFSGEEGVVISMGKGNSLQLDDDIVSFMRNGKQKGWWDGIYFHTGNIVIGLDELAQFGNFALTSRSDESLSMVKVGG